MIVNFDSLVPLFLVADFVCEQLYYCIVAFWATLLLKNLTWNLEETNLMVIIIVMNELRRMNEIIFW